MLSKLGHTVINPFNPQLFFSLGFSLFRGFLFALMSWWGRHEVDCYLRDTKWNHTCSSTVPIRKETIVACVSTGFQQKTNIPLVRVDWLECLQEACVWKPSHTGWQNPKYIIRLSSKMNTPRHASPTLAMKAGSEGCVTLRAQRQHGLICATPAQNLPKKLRDRNYKDCNAPVTPSRGILRSQNCRFGRCLDISW